MGKIRHVTGPALELRGLEREPRVALRAEKAAWPREQREAGRELLRERAMRLEGDALPNWFVVSACCLTALIEWIRM